MYRLLNTVRLLPSSIIVRLNSTYKIPVQNITNIDDENDEDDNLSLNKTRPPKDLIFADSKSSRFKEKNPRKQKQWLKELEQKHIVPKTPLSSFAKETNTKAENKIIQDRYVTPDGIIREDNFPINFDTELDENDEEKEPDEPKPLAVGGRRYPIWFYAGKLKHLASENKVQATLDYFYKEMMDKERVAPNLFCYQVVIGVCARNGYLTQAFNLYREMKDRGFTTVDSRKMTKIFTLLATACYRASDSKMAIERFRIEYRTFNSLIAAFGKHGHVKMAFQLADEMVEVGFIPNEDTYVSLLIACSAEKTTGFKYAIEIWRRMLAFGVKPNPFHFGLLLNITHNCGLGSPTSLHDLLFPSEPLQFLFDEAETTDIQQKLHQGPSFLSSMDISDRESLSTISNTNDENQHQLISSEIIECQDKSRSSELTSEWWQDPEDIRMGHLLKNHLSPFNNASVLKPNMSYKEPNLVSLRMPNSPAERLMLLGGIPGVLKHMQECNVLPNHIIFNSFLNVIPQLSDHEQALIHISNICQVKPNIQFYNALILRRLQRRSKQEALQVLDLMREECLSPDEYTFSALAKGCENRQDAEQLLNEMTELNLKPNQKVLEAMLRNAFYRTNFPLLSLICESYKTYNLAVNKGFLERIEKFLLDIRSKILAMEHANVDNEQYRLLSSSYNRFQKFYNRWLSEVSYAKRFDQKVSFVYDKPDLKK
ncbi:unnamed protein product [Rotaria socialis]|uniref:Pentatricopeptide repeat-containing protein n=2 Tax=Rotaria socialis TaxID=392032 RepID=A0A817WW47_9BILA|nr:unnamed protein product [Rotaria socialis]CAF3792411.1 unnamed protein product [Rotaria socialis]